MYVQQNVTFESAAHLANNSALDIYNYVSHLVAIETRDEYNFLQSFYGNLLYWTAGTYITDKGTLVYSIFLL